MRWLIISLLCLVGCSSGSDPAPLQAAQSISWDFESAAFPHPQSTPTQFPAVVLLEGSPHFHYGRLTALPSDCGPSYFTSCPTTRAEGLFNEITVADGTTMTFLVDLRLPSSGTGGSNTGTHTLMVGQLFANTAGGRSVWLGVNTSNHWYIANEMQPCSNPGCAAIDPLFGDSTLIQMIDLGAVVYDQWESFSIVVLISTTTAGTVQISKNGTDMGTMTQQATALSVSVAQQVWINVLDPGGNFGIVDFDNLAMTDVQPPP